MRIKKHPSGKLNDLRGVSFLTRDALVTCELIHTDFVIHRFISKHDMVFKTV